MGRRAGKCCTYEIKQHDWCSSPWSAWQAIPQSFKVIREVVHTSRFFPPSLIEALMPRYV